GPASRCGAAGSDGCRSRSERLQVGWFAGRRSDIGRDELERGMTDGRAKEPAAFVGHIEKPTRPAFRTALGVDQVAHDGQRLIASRGSTRQLDPFLVRQHALTEAEME